jgi:hypothetical protein
VWVPARVADHVRPRDVEIGRPVQVAVDPQVHAIALHQRGEVAGEGADERLVHDRGRPLTHERGVVSDHDGGTVVRHRESLREPLTAGRVQRPGVLGPKSPPLLAPGDHLVVVDHAAADIHRALQLSRAGGHEVAPQGAAEEADAVEHQLVVLQDLHRAARRLGAHPVGERREGVAVVLVVAGHEQDRPAAGPAAGEPDAGGSLPDVPRQHDHLGVDPRELEGGELYVEVADDM